MSSCSCSCLWHNYRLFLRSRAARLVGAKRGPSSGPRSRPGLSRTICSFATGNCFQPSKRETGTIQKQKYALLTAKEHRLATSGEHKERNVLVSWNFERSFSRSNCCEHWRRSDFDDFTWFSEYMVDHIGLVLITAFLGNHKLKGFQEILNVLSKTERADLFKAIADFCLANTSPLATAGTKIYNWIHSKKWAKKDIVLYVKGASSLRNKQNESTLNIFFFAIGRNLQFFNCHEFVMFSDRHQLSKSPFQWFDSIKITPVERLKILSRASSTFIPGASTWFRESPFLNFQLEPCADALILAEPCWETNMAESESSIWLISSDNSKRVWHICLKKKTLSTSNRCFQLWFVAQFLPQKRNREFEKKWHWNANTFKELRSFGLKDTFCRLKDLCLTIYLVWSNKMSRTESKKQCFNLSRDY